MDANVTGDLNVWRSLLSLVLILGAMWGFLWWVRRRRGENAGTTRRMKVIERLPIDARRSLMLVRVDGEDVMIGVSADRINLLKTLNPPERDEA